MELLIDKFLRPVIPKNRNGNGNGNGDGDGNGNGDGNGDGDGNGNGYGDGNGNGNGYGDGNGDGNGDGDGLKSINNQKVHLIDNVQTIISNIKKDIAKGFILNKDLSTTPCFIVRNNNFFSHGKTLREANKSLQRKILDNLSIDEKIEKFKNVFTNISVKYPASLYYQWHSTLTDSCEMGKESFCKNHQIDIEKDSFTIKEFIDITINSYGSEIINRLKKSYKFK